MVDLYGRTGRFDVIAITDHILMKRDLLARAGRLASLGRRRFSIQRVPQAKHLYSWKTLLRCEKTWPAVKTALRANADVALLLYCHGGAG